MDDFIDHVALVTGGGSGLGATISRELASRGAAVMVTDINESSAAQVAEEIVKVGGRASSMRHDTADLKSHEAVVAETARTFGNLTLAVNNAGIAHPRRRHRRNGYVRLGSAYCHQPQWSRLRVAPSNPLHARKWRRIDCKHVINPRFSGSGGGAGELCRRKARLGRSHQNRSTRVRPAGHPRELGWPGIHQDAASG